MKVLMFLHSLNPAAGVEQYIVSLLPELRNLGVDVCFCIELPPPADNQYYRQLRQHGFTVHYPHWGPLVFRGWSWPVDLVLSLFFPFTLIMMLIDRVVRRRSWRQSYIGLRGRLNNLTQQWRPEWLSSVPSWVTLSWLWLRFRPNVVHVLRVDSVAALRWSLMLHLPTVYTEALEPDGYLHYPFLAPYYRQLEKIASRIPVIVTQSDRVRKAIEARWLVMDSVCVLPWVVKVPASSPELKAHHDKFTFGYAGRLSPEKNLETFLEAAKELRARNIDKVAFVIAGTGPAEAGLKEYAGVLGIDDCVSFTGLYTVDSIASVFAMMDVFVITSLTEGAPLAVIEAMAYAKPVIATDVAGTGELICDGDTGFLVETRDVQAIVAAGERLMRNPGMARNMCQSAAERYQRCFSPPAGAAQLHNLYVKLEDIPRR